MIIKRARISNFRSITKLQVNFLPYMVFVGKNNSGKSNIMKALDVFFTDSVEVNDFRIEHGKPKQKMEIILWFSDLNKDEKKLFEGKILDEGQTNERLIIRYTASLRGEGVKIDKQYEYVAPALNLKTHDQTDQYGGLLDDELYRSKSKIEKANDIPDEFKERVNTFLSNKDSGRFSKAEYLSLRTTYIEDLIKKKPELGKLGYMPLKIAKKSLSTHFGNFFFIPAVQDVENETRYTATGKRNLNLLMNYVLDKMQDPEQKEQKEMEIQKILKAIYQIGRDDSEISELETLLNEQLQTFDNSKISFDTELPDISRLIRDSLRVYIDDGIKTEVSYKGHGLQRYFMVILFKAWSQKLTEMRAQSVADKKGKDATCTSAYFAIEEPELFLHPQYQRMMLSYLQNIAEEDGHQVILNTHSPHFIEFNNMLQVAKVYKRNLRENTRVIQPLEYDDEGNFIEKDFIHSWGSAREQEKFKRINTINMNYYLNPNRNELFFADKVVLVEGQTEKMLFQSWANYFFPDDIATLCQTTYIDCLGKFNMQHYIQILDEFRIPFVVVLDSDSDKSEKTRGTNRYIKRDANKAKGAVIELEPDFEREFVIKDFEIDEELMKNKHKPFYAYAQFFDSDGNPKSEELEVLKGNQKLRQIFNQIYDLSL